ncbi:MAG: SEL1-like repeat protein [Alphaproteobacteria bacterium]|nr:SEL1-like repeat protein [Alphaproteobacteria bacterium]
MLELSSIYRNGRGVPQDNVTAYMWFAIHAADVYVEEPNSRETAEKDMTPTDISRAEVMAREWLEAHKQNR